MSYELEEVEDTDWLTSYYFLLTRFGQKFLDEDQAKKEHKEFWADSCWQSKEENGNQGS